ncbi:MAG: 2-amino-4-hydroxy-6-hydroxymethyldihydropteridine diphosphokinase [Elusimicrobiota bacterium]|jgi:2-amino-4-hydroxy-6-hydroxymethyldihydropteridine diphosphokinase|nr:2-amino-4-hydroxy-6-hydroxymethyldihydropteridine diphosphokinase [Elusimicrobiota bacterium]
MTKVFLGLGSNIGNRKENLFAALSFLESSNEAQIEKISSIYETSPIGPKQKKFYNMVIEIFTSLNCFDLLKLIKDIEHEMGRKKTIRWGKRNIDIDILFFGNEKIKTKNLIIPHKEILNRLFTLVPLAEISPNFIYPKSNKTIKTILNEKLLLLKNQKIKTLNFF